MSNGKIQRIVLAGACAVAFAGVARGSAVPISYVTQDRSVSASSSATGFPRSGTTATPVTDQDSHSQQANGFGAFDGNAAANSDIGPQSASATGTASQTSSLGDTGFSVSGSVVADTVFGGDGPANAAAGSVFHITFDVAAAESFVFSADLSGSKNLSEPGATSALIKLIDGSGNDIFAPVTSVNLSGFTETGTLNPGTYSFALDMKATSDDESKGFVNYSVSFADGTTGSTGGTGGTNPVPLPSSGLEAIVMLSCLGAYCMVRRRLPGWVRMSMI